MAKISWVIPQLSEFKSSLEDHSSAIFLRETPLTVPLFRRGAPGGKLKMTLGLPVYVLDSKFHTS